MSGGAASIRGQITTSDDAKVEPGLAIYLTPSERDRLDDPLRYFTSEINSDRTFALSNLPPGKYWTLVQQRDPDAPTSTEKLRLPDEAEARLKLRRAAELKKMEVELKPCQNLNEFKLRAN